MNEALFDAGYQFMKRHNLPCIVSSSTHLSLYLGIPFFPNDTEIDFCLDSETFDANKMKLLMSPEYREQNDAITNRGLYFFDVGAPIPLSQYTFTDAYGVLNLIGTTFYVLKKEWLLPWKPLVYKDYDLLQPNQPEKVFSYIYGKNWREEAGKVWRHGDIYIQAQSVEDAIRVHDTSYAKNIASQS